MHQHSWKLIYRDGSLDTNDWQCRICGELKQTRGPYVDLWLMSKIKSLLLRIGYWFLEKDPPPDEIDHLGLPVIRNVTLDDILDDNSYVRRMDRLRKEVEACIENDDEINKKFDELPNKITYSTNRR